MKGYALLLLFFPILAIAMESPESSPECVTKEITVRVEKHTGHESRDHRSCSTCSKDTLPEDSVSKKKVIVITAVTTVITALITGTVTIVSTYFSTMYRCNN